MFFFVIIFLFTYFQVPVALCSVSINMRFLCRLESNLLSLQLKDTLLVILFIYIMIVHVYYFVEENCRGFIQQFLKPFQLFLCGVQSLRFTYFFYSNPYNILILCAYDSNLNIYFLFIIFKLFVESIYFMIFSIHA